jgi:hypothetical protein
MNKYAGKQRIFNALLNMAKKNPEGAKSLANKLKIPAPLGEASKKSIRIYLD